MISKFKSGVIVAKHDETIASALEKMDANNIGSILVVNGESAVGIITERDVLKNWRDIGNPGFLSKPVSALMASPLITTTPDKLGDAGQIMLTKKIRHVPVLDHGGAILGIVSARDILHSLIEDSLIGAVKTRKPVEKKKAGPAPVPARLTLHLLTPSIGLEVACRSLLPANWIFQSWLDPHALFDEKRFSADILSGQAAFFVDLDGLKNHDWRAVLKKFIRLLTEKAQPEVFIAWSPAMLNEAEVDALIKVAASARWNIFQKPLALGALAEEFRKLNERVSTRQS